MRSSQFRRGQASFELAILAPALILMVLGIIELGRIAHFGILVNNAARAGVQYGSQNLVTAIDTSGMQNAALADGQNIGGLSASATYFCQCSDGTAASCTAAACSANHRVTYVQVTASGTFSTLFHYPRLPSSFALTRTATLRVPQ